MNYQKGIINIILIIGIIIAGSIGFFIHKHNLKKQLPSPAVQTVIVPEVSTQEKQSTTIEPTVTDTQDAKIYVAAMRENCERNILDPGVTGQCSFSFSLKNTNDSAITISVIKITSAPFTPVPANSIEYLHGADGQTLFKGTAIGHTLLLRPLPNIETTIQSGETRTFTLSTYVPLSTVGKAQFSLVGITTTMGEAVLDNHPSGAIMQYLTAKEVGTYTAQPITATQDKNFIGGIMKIKEQGLLGGFTVFNNLNSSSSIQRLTFKIVTDDNLNKLIPSIKIGSITGAIYGSAPVLESADTFSLSAPASLEGGANMNYLLYATPASAGKQIRVDLIDVTTENGSRPTNLPIEGYTQSTVR